MCVYVYIFLNPTEDVHANFGCKECHTYVNLYVNTSNLGK